MKKQPNNNLEKDLQKLNAMLKKPANASFREQLRKQLKDQATQMNTENSSVQQAEKSESQKGFAWNSQSVKNLTDRMGRFFRVGLIPAAALAILILFAVNLIGPIGQVLQPLQLVDIAAAHDYYTLTPTKDSPAGVDPNSEFILSSKGSIKATEIQENLKVTPQATLQVSQKSDNEVTVKSTSGLEKNEVYSFTLLAQNLSDSPYKQEYNWAYQVSDELAVTGTTPSNINTGVAINTGIEVEFNAYGITVEDFQKHLTIEPSVEGRVDIHGKTAAFIPNANLKEETLYTVTVREGLPLGDSDKTLKEAHSFSFETSSSTKNQTRFSINKNLLEFAPNTEPFFFVNYTNWGTEEAENGLSGAVYRFPNEGAFVEAMKDKSFSIPTWTRYQKESLNTESLQKIASFEDLPFLQSYGRDYFQVPQQLTEGFYLVEATKNDIRDQALIQVSNVTTYLRFSKTNAFGWFHDTNTGKPMANLTIEQMETGKKVTTNEQGYADTSALINQSKEYQNDILRITQPNGKNTYYMQPSVGEETDLPDNWTYMLTDRIAYHPTDTVYYWAFLQGKETPVSGKATVTLSSGSGWYPDVSKDDIFYQQEIDLQNGKSLEGKIDIEKMPVGYYVITIVQNGQRITATSFEVQDFIKPEYQIQVTPQKIALFYGESTIIDIASTFFEGTPVANLPIRFHEGYYNGANPISEIITTDESGKAQTTFTASSSTCPSSDDLLWKQYCSLFGSNYFTVTPQQSELADITGTGKVTVVRSSVGAPRQDMKITHDNIELQLRNIDIKKVADSIYPSEWSDVWGKTAAGKKVVVNIQKADRSRTVTGQNYDPLTKTTLPVYKYSTNYVNMINMELISDENGKVQFNPLLPKNDYYRIKISIFDGEGRSYNTSQYLGLRPNTQANQIFLESAFEDEKKYAIGETVEMTIKKTTGESLPSDGSQLYLYSIGSDGKALENRMSTSPQFTETFTKEFVPALHIKAYMFDGKRYQETVVKAVNFQKEDRGLTINANTNQQQYEPGEEVTLNLNVRDKSGTPAPNTHVNLFLVDEAYYALFAESFRDPLSTLYSSTWTSFGSSYTSDPGDIPSDGSGLGGCFIAGTQILMEDGSLRAIENVRSGERILTRSTPFSEHLIPAKVAKTYEHTVSEYLLINGLLGVTKEHIIFLNGQWQLAEKAKVGDTLTNVDGTLTTIQTIQTIHKTIKVYNFEVEKYHTYFANGFYVHNDKGGTRDTFKDTAVFKTITTDSNGNGSVTFELPDNITTWRASMIGIQSGIDVRAGQASIQIPVTKPLFVLPTINPNYLLGDKPSIPLKAFGTALSAATDLEFKVAIPELGFIKEQTGKAYSPIYMELPELPLGTHRIETTAQSGNKTDTVALNTTVEATHLKINRQWEDMLNESTVVPGSSDDRTEIILTNAEVGTLYGIIRSILYTNISSADMAAGKQVSKKLLNEYFQKNYTLQDFDPSPYQNTSVGRTGISPVPHGDANLKMTSLLLDMDQTLWVTKSAKAYLISTLEDPKETLTRKLQALYGLGALKTPYLTELNYLTEHYDMNVEDHLYAALAYLKYGAKNKAAEHFLKIMEQTEPESDGLKVIAPQGADKDDQLSLNTLTAYLASELQSDQRDALWEHVQNNDSRLISAEKLLYAQSRLTAGVAAESSVNVNGKTITLKNTEQHILSVLPEELKELSFSNIQGNIHILSSYDEPLNKETEPKTEGLAITRKYLVNGQQTSTFKPGDIVKVEITYNIPQAADFKGGYEVRDYLPSGLLPLTQSGYNQMMQNGNWREYWHPYRVDGQEIRFSIFCRASDMPKCSQQKRYYFARVINKGTFKEEPMVIQSFELPSRLNLSFSGQKRQVTVE